MQIHPLAVQHLGQVVQLHLSAFPTFFLSFLGSRFLREFYSSFLGIAGGLAFVAVSGEGKVLGVVAGPLNPRAYFTKLLLRRWWAFCIASLPSLLRQPSCAARLLRAVFYRGEAPSDRNRALLSTIAVLPDAQHHGLGRALARHWLGEVRRLGAKGGYAITDAEDNAGVNLFYKTLDWTLECTYTTPEGRRVNRYIFDFPQVPEATRTAFVGKQ